MNSNVAIWLTLFLWGIIPVIDKLALSEKKVDIFVGITFRVFFVAILFIIYLFLSSDFREKLYQTPKTIMFLFGLSGIFSLFLAQYCYYVALKDSSVSKLFPFLFASSPIITVILSFVILKEKLSFNVIVGSILIFIGSIFLLRE